MSPIKVPTGLDLLFPPDDGTTQNPPRAQGVMEVKNAPMFDHNGVLIAPPKQTHKLCPKCKKYKFVEEFGKNAFMADGLQMMCDTCRYEPPTRHEIKIGQNKVCCRCGIKKPITEFNRRASSSDGHRSECRECGNADDRGHYKSRTKPKEEQKIHNPESGLNCPICGFHIPTKRGLGLHISKIHPEKCLYICKLCGSSSYSASGLSQHWTTHHNGKMMEESPPPQPIKECESKPKGIVCKVCGVSLASLSGASIHYSAWHPEVCQYKCPHCEKRAYTKSALNAHINDKHNQRQVAEVTIEKQSSENKGILSRLKGFLRRSQ